MGKREMNGNETTETIADEMTETTETTTAETNTEVEEVEETTDLQLFVERRVAKDKLGKIIKTAAGESLYNYVLPVEVDGHKHVVNFNAVDEGGYKNLAIVYKNNDLAQLSITKNTKTDFKGKKQEIITYIVSNYNENGKLRSCRVRLSRGSDLDFFNMYLDDLKDKAVK